MTSRSCLVMIVVSVACSLGCGDRGAPENDTPAALPPSPLRTVPGSQGRPSESLKAWMKSNAAPASVAGDTRALERVFTSIGGLAPRDYPEWESMAKRGAAAAHADDLEGCRYACKSCHDTYRARYRAEKPAP